MQAAGWRSKRELGSEQDFLGGEIAILVHGGRSLEVRSEAPHRCEYYR